MQARVQGREVCMHAGEGGGRGGVHACRRGWGEGRCACMQVAYESLPAVLQGTLLDQLLQHPEVQQLFCRWVVKVQVGVWGGGRRGGNRVG